MDSVFTMPSLRLIPKGKKRSPFPPGMVIRVSEGTCTPRGAHMRKKSTNQPNQSGATVTPIRQQPPQIEPPEGVFDLRSAFGFMAFKEGNEGRLVRLAEVLRWIEHSQSLPRVAALKKLCDGLQPEAMQWLYWLRDTDYATPVPPDHLFGYKTADELRLEQISREQKCDQQQWENSQTNSLGVPRPQWNAVSGSLTFVDQEATEPGLPALLKALQAYWTRKKFNAAAKVEILDDLRFKHLTPLAIRLDKAHEIWGYGRDVSATEGADATASAATSASSEWTGERLSKEQIAIKAKGHKDWTKQLVQISGVEETEIRRRIKKFRDAAKQAGPFGAMARNISQGEKTAKKA